MERIPIHTIPGFSFGQVEDRAGGTGCTVILCPQGAVTGVDVRGGSPGTRDTDAPDPVCNREVVHAVVLTGGSAFGLDAEESAESIIRVADSNMNNALKLISVRRGYDPRDFAMVAFGGAQAAAAMSAQGVQGSELLLAYEDSGTSELLQAEWIAIQNP